jgi:hypothetical protein
MFYKRHHIMSISHQNYSLGIGRTPSFGWSKGRPQVTLVLIVILLVACLHVQVILGATQALALTVTVLVGHRHVQVILVAT